MKPKIEYYTVNRNRLEIIKKCVEEGNLRKIMEMYPDELNICSNRLDHIEVNENEVLFFDRGVTTNGRTMDFSWGVKTI